MMMVMMILSHTYLISSLTSVHELWGSGFFSLVPLTAFDRNMGLNCATLYFCQVIIGQPDVVLVIMHSALLVLRHSTEFAI